MKRIERHKLKENEFAKTVVHARQTLEQRKRDITVIALVVVVLLAGVAGYLWWRQSRAASANEMLATAGAVPQLVRHDVWDWHVHAVTPDRDLATRIKVEAAMAMIDVIRADEMSRLGVCADDDCRGVVLDLSRNRSKRFCSTTCGNRNAVAAYRARQR